ncbi:MAG: hypothetical protein H8E38_05950 [SAR324 cluster bacterium]|nr:hypothetical protein [SAR324 cluster bacterium]
MKNRFFGQRILRKKKKSLDPTRIQIEEALNSFKSAGGKIQKVGNEHDPEDKTRRAYSNFDGEFGSILEEEERWDDF